MWNVKYYIFISTSMYFLGLVLVSLIEIFWNFTIVVPQWSNLLWTSFDAEEEFGGNYEHGDPTLLENLGLGIFPYFN